MVTSESYWNIEALIFDSLINKNLTMKGSAMEDERKFKLAGRWEVQGYFTAKDILAQEPCNGEFNLFVKRFGFYETIRQEEIDWMTIGERKKVWVDWLEDHMFIEKVTVVPKVVFSKYPEKEPGLCIGMKSRKEGSRAVFSLFKNGEKCDGATLFHLELHDGVFHITPYTSVHGNHTEEIFKLNPGGQVYWQRNEGGA